MPSLLVLLCMFSSGLAFAQSKSELIEKIVNLYDSGNNSVEEFKKSLRSEKISEAERKAIIKSYSDFRADIKKMAREDLNGQSLAAVQEIHAVVTHPVVAKQAQHAKITNGMDVMAPGRSGATLSPERRSIIEKIDKITYMSQGMKIVVQGPLEKVIKRYAKSMPQMEGMIRSQMKSVLSDPIALVASQFKKFSMKELNIYLTEVSRASYKGFMSRFAPKMYKKLATFVDASSEVYLKQI